MNIEAHIAGPWECSWHKSGDDCSIDTGYWSITGAVLRNDDGVIADTLNRHHCISPDEDHANAKLLSAAPLLLEACKAAELLLLKLSKEIPATIYVAFSLGTVLTKCEDAILAAIRKNPI